MKRLLPLLLMLLCLAPALAEDDPEALFLAAHSLDEIECYAVNGDTAAAIMNYLSERTLCVAERRDGQWVLTVDNDEALHIGSDYLYTLIIPSDNVLEWHCDAHTEYDSTYEIWHSEKTDEGWHFPTMTDHYENGSLRIDTHYRWQDGLLTRVEELQISKNQPILTDLMPLPAGWTKRMTTLADFDLSVLPIWIPSYAFSGYVEGAAVWHAARELFPSYTYIGGQLCNDSLHLMMDKPDGTRVFIGVTWDGEWHFTESTPLPKDCVYFDLYRYCEINFPDEVQFNLAPDQDGIWGVDCLVSYSEDDCYDASCIIKFRQNLIITYDNMGDPIFIVGEHPWGDITVIDWSSLPASIEDTWAMVDSSGWAMVNDPLEDFPILYELPAQDARCLGKYRSGTPVRVLEEHNDWTRVDIGGVQGWMETAHLAFGSDMSEVDSHLLNLDAVTDSDTDYVYLCSSPGSEPDSATLWYQMIILGDFNDDWYHVYDGIADQYGYVRHEPSLEYSPI